MWLVFRRITLHAKSVLWCSDGPFILPLMYCANIVMQTPPPLPPNVNMSYFLSTPISMFNTSMRSEMLLLFPHLTGNISYLEIYNVFFVATVLTTIYDTSKANRLKYNYMTYYIKVMRSHRNINVALTLRTVLTIQKHKGTMQLKPSCQSIN